VKKITEKGTCKTCVLCCETPILIPIGLDPRSNIFFVVVKILPQQFTEFLAHQAIQKADKQGFRLGGVDPV